MSGHGVGQKRQILSGVVHVFIFEYFWLGSGGWWRWAGNLGWTTREARTTHSSWLGRSHFSEDRTWASISECWDRSRSRISEDWTRRR